MALNIAPYSQTHFQSLPSLNAARGSFVASNGNGLVNGVFKDFFINNNMERTFGLIMLHRHFDINPGEKTANYNSTFTVWNTKPGEGMGEPQPVIWGFSSEALVPLEFIYSKEHRFAISEKETSFIIKFKRLLEENGLVEMFGLCVYPGDDFEGSREITMGSVNINPKPNDYPEGLMQTPTAWFFPGVLWTRGCRCTSDNRHDPHAHGAHVHTQSD